MEFKVKNVDIKITRVNDMVPWPKYATDGSVGCDLRCYKAYDEYGRGIEDGDSCAFALRPYQRAFVHTGLSVEIPPGFEGQIRPRSSLACKFGVLIPNAPGTIDSDYRGELIVGLYNTSHKPFRFSRGYAVAQLVIAPVVRAVWNPVSPDCLTETERGAGGFGSTDCKP